MNTDKQGVRVRQKLKHITAYNLPIAVFIFAVLIITLFVIAINNKSSCKDIYAKAQKSTNEAKNKNDFNKIYKKLEKNYGKCSSNIHDIRTSVNYSYIYVYSAYLSGREKQAVDTAKQAQNWIINNVHENTNTATFNSQMSDIRDLGLGYLPASFSVKENELNRQNEN